MKIQLFGVATLLVCIQVFSGCSDDEPKPAVAGFEDASMDVTESDGTIDSFHPFYLEEGVGKTYTITVKLDKKASENTVIAFETGGTASNLIDYAVEGNTVTIPKDSDTGTIKITVFEDLDFEYEDLNEDFIPIETISINLSSVIAGKANLGENTSFTLNISEDDVLVYLQWDPLDQEGDDGGDVDMDLFVWLDGELFDGSAYRDNEPEYVIIPGGYPDGTYSFSHTYYDGTSDNLEFNAVMFGPLNNNYYPFPDEALVKTGNYTLANKNTYDETAEVPDVAIVQSFVKSGVNFNSVSEITEPVTGSRVGQRSVSEFSKLINKGETKGRFLRLDESLLKK